MTVEGIPTTTFISDNKPTVSNEKTNTIKNGKVAAFQRLMNRALLAKRCYVFTKSRPSAYVHYMMS